MLMFAMYNRLIFSICQFQLDKRFVALDFLVFAICGTYTLIKLIKFAYL